LENVSGHKSEEPVQKCRHICYVAPSFDFVDDYRFARKQCPGLVESGFDVSYFVQGEEDVDFKGVKIIAIKPEKNKAKKVLLPWKLLVRLLRYPCDAYHLSNAEMLPIAVILKIFTRRRVIFDFREDYVEYTRLKPYFQGFLNPIVVGIAQAFVWTICKYMDGIVFGDEGVQENYTTIPGSRQTFVHHFPLLSIFKPNPIAFSDRKYDVVYLGTMSKTGGIFVMLEAMAILKKRNKDFKALLIGQPAVYVEDEFYKFVNENDLQDTVEITGKVPYEQVPELLNHAKVGLIGLTNLPKFHKQSAAKLFEYMTKGIPCVSVDLPPERRFMESGQQGYFVPTEEPEAMADAVYKILSDPEEGKRMSENARNHLVKQGYYGEKEMESLADFYNHILTRPRRRFCGN